MPSVAVNPPKTPVTEASNGIATATVPNVCKMPGPPAPFVPTPLPNIGKSGNSPNGYSTSVTVEGNAVAIRGATFDSMGDVASKATGGGLVSMNTQGPTKFVGPGSPNVTIEGKAVHQLGEPMANNCDPGASTPNAATTPGEMQGTTPPGADGAEDECAKLKAKFGIKTGPYKNNPGSKADGVQSHHVLQNAQMEPAGVPHADGFSILLGDSKSGTEHCTVNNLQKARASSKSTASTYGQLRKDAQSDLAAGLEGRRQDAEGNTMTQAEAAKAAECIVAEADKAAKKTAKDKGISLDDNTPVNQVGKCVAAGTLVWLASGELRAVERLKAGDRIRTTAGDRAIVRVDTCLSPAVELVVAGTRLVVARYHRFVDDEGMPIRADALRPGDFVSTARGMRAVEAVSHREEAQRLYGLGLSEGAIAYLEAAALLTELVDGGPPVRAQEAAFLFDAGAG
jgi:hypothetical protein